MFLFDDVIMADEQATSHYVKQMMTKFTDVYMRP